MKVKPTGKFATPEQQQQINAAYQLDYCTPIMATLPEGRVPQSSEDFRDMANRFAHEAGLPDGIYGVDPETREFCLIAEYWGRNKL